MNPTLYYVVRVNRSLSDTYAAPSLDAAYQSAMLDRTDVVEWGEVYASDAGAARLMSPEAWRPIQNVWPESIPVYASASTMEPGPD